MYRTIEELQTDWGITEYETVCLESSESFGEVAVGARTVEEATGALERSGYQQVDFLIIVNDAIGSHNQRADAIIALGGVVRQHFVVVGNLQNCDYQDGVHHPSILTHIPDNMAVEALKKRWRSNQD